MASLARTREKPSRVDFEGVSDREPLLLFNISKEEQYHAQKGYKSLMKRMRVKSDLNKDDIESSKLAHYRVFVSAGPRRKFSTAEFKALKDFVFEGGGSLLILLGEDGVAHTNLNAYLEDLGITINADVVVRTQFFKYFHPKECFVSSGVLNRGLMRGSGDDNEAAGRQLNFVYPYGATLNVKDPAIPVLSSGSVSFPLNRPVAAFYTHPRSNGKIAVIGSPMMFSDAYVDKEDNFKIFQLIYKFLTTEEVALNVIDADDPDITDYNFIPDSKALAEQLKVCLQEGEELPTEINEWFDARLFAFDIDCLPKVVKAYYELGVKHRQLALIKPNFVVPTPPLRPAAYPPQFRDLPPAGLDLYDLDDQFASEKERLAQLCNKCGDDDLEYFVRECGEILGVSNKITSGDRDGKHVLGHVLQQIVEAKKLS